MAKPKSEKKRQAILDAALEVCAKRGIADAPTSAISKAAGVAEGTLFTYFRTKEELMHELYLELRQIFSRQLSDFPDGKDPHTRMRYIWDRYLELGMARPEQLKVLTQLRVPGELFRKNEKPAMAFVEILKALREVTKDDDLSKAPPEYLVLLVRAQAETTLEFIMAHPESEAACRELGFKALWRGLTGEQAGR